MLIVQFVTPQIILSESHTMILLETWTTPFGLVPFYQIEDADFAPAINKALDIALDGIAKIADDPQAPTFENTIDAQEEAEALLEQVASVFYTLAGSDSTPVREKLQREFAPKLSAYASAVASNAKLFARIEALWNSRKALKLTKEQERVLMLTRRSFVRAGALLVGVQALRMADIKSQLASLGTNFTQNLLSDERTWFMALGPDDLVGLPDFVLQVAQAAGLEKGAKGPVVTLSRSLIVPFLEFSDRRDLREVAYKAWAARGANNGETDNRTIASETLALRHERASLLGFASFADFV